MLQSKRNVIGKEQLEKKNRKREQIGKKNNHKSCEQPKWPYLSPGSSCYQPLKPWRSRATCTSTWGGDWENGCFLALVFLISDGSFIGMTYQHFLRGLCFISAELPEQTLQTLDVMVCCLSSAGGKSCIHNKLTITWGAHDDLSQLAHTFGKGLKTCWPSCLLSWLVMNVLFIEGSSLFEKV